MTVLFAFLSGMFVILLLIIAMLVVAWIRLGDNPVVAAIRTRRRVDDLTNAAYIAMSEHAERRRRQGG